MTLGERSKEEPKRLMEECFKQYDDCRYFRQKEIKTEINIIKNMGILEKSFRKKS